MKWSLLELNKFQHTQLEFDEVLDLEASLLERDREIIAVKPVHVSGFLSVEPDKYLAYFTVETVVTLPSSRSLTPVDVPLVFSTDETYMTTAQFQQIAGDDKDAEEEIMILEKDTIDLIEAVEDFVLLNLPSQVLSEEEKQATELPKGEFWAIISEEDYEKQRQTTSEAEVDPRLAKLSELFEENE
ncbi:YceD family protein [Vagococcus acidifermentans]|uniref:Nucleic acid-binding protein n=1 Tax=Vagococcus acidifermentans TaxID=564710 RepID=A0A430APJ5_9ENTE|nr:YceD family protein [Vagococcus acidifermentans]RSU09903.1 hypothetical protein CBF27_11425 [Vagococcus acidifermentans]